MAHEPAIKRPPFLALLAIAVLVGALLYGCGDDKRVVCAPKDGSGDPLCRAAGSVESGEPCTRSTQCRGALYCIDERCQECFDCESWDRNQSCITSCSGPDACNFFIYNTCAGRHDMAFPDLCLDGKLYRCANDAGTACCPGLLRSYQVVGACGENTPGCDSDGDQDEAEEAELICAPKDGSGDLLCRAAGSGRSGESCTRSTQCQAAFYCVDERCQEWLGSESWDRDKSCITSCSGPDACNFFMFDVCAGWHDFNFPDLCLDGKLYRCADDAGTACCPGLLKAYQVVAACGENTPGCDSDGDRN